ncbi:MAG TPA: hypothetical protein DCS15_07360 [Flavobacteriales bacterium]|jgi:hypothetical protein|nr:lipocalin family protein [Salibacteraceae bacterium]HAS36289.1 hypothetical protein [Flavobacteriales bacterium]
MKKFLTAIALVGILGLAACTSENQKIVDQLEGTWKVTQVTVNGIPLDESTYENDQYTFESCSASADDCTGSYRYEDPTKGTTTSSFSYSVEDDGTKLKMSLFSGTADIIESSDSRFIWSETDSFGDVTETTIEKV